MSSLSINSNSSNSSRPSSPTASFQIRSSSFKEKNKQPDIIIDIPTSNETQCKEIEIEPSSVSSDIAIDIASSSSNKADFHEGLQQFIHAFKNFQVIPIEETDRMRALKKQYAQNKKNIFKGIGLATTATTLSSGIMATIIFSKNNILQGMLATLETISIPLTLYFFNDVGDNLSKNKQINKQINDLRSIPPQITLGQVKETYMEQCNDFVVTDDESDKKEFINFFDENQIVFLANTSTIIQEDSYIAFKDDILSLENKTEVTKEDFLNVIAQNVVKILQPMTLSSDENDVKRKLLETAQELLEKSKSPLEKQIIAES